MKKKMYNITTIHPLVLVNKVWFGLVKLVLQVVIITKTEKWGEKNYQK